MEPRERVLSPAFIIAQHHEDAVVTLAANASDPGMLEQATSWSWAMVVRGRIVLDASRVQRMTPQLCRWIAEVVRAAPPHRVIIHGRCEGLREAVLALRLDARLEPAPCTE